MFDNIQKWKKLCNAFQHWKRTSSDWDNNHIAGIIYDKISMNTYPVYFSYILNIMYFVVGDLLYNSSIAHNIVNKYIDHLFFLILDVQKLPSFVRQI